MQRRKMPKRFWAYFSHIKESRAYICSSYTRIIHCFPLKAHIRTSTSTHLLNSNSCGVSHSMHRLPTYPSLLLCHCWLHHCQPACRAVISWTAGTSTNICRFGGYDVTNCSRDEGKIRSHALCDVLRCTKCPDMQNTNYICVIRDEMLWLLVWVSGIYKSRLRHRSPKRMVTLASCFEMNTLML